MSEVKLTAAQRESLSKHPGGFRIYRNSRGWPVWWQRFAEAWWILTGQWSLHRAWQEGSFQGHSQEYQRIVVNGGELTAIRRRRGRLALEKEGGE